MKLAHALTILALLTLASGAFAATATSSFDGATFAYSYTITPEMGEDLKSFHVYTGLSECDATHYHDVIMPAGWMFDALPNGDACVLTFWTTGDALPADQIADFGFIHYCAPCCHSWYVSDEGTDNPNVNVVDDDEQHTEPCNIQAPFNDQCGGPGLLLAPIYPVSVPDDTVEWGSLKNQYR